ncbi:MAG: type IX secretion system sortase PorU [Bacteroidetes bacterium]|nr:type IX secretion system sortase PorU [Bacteroidota bacterium]
MAAFFRKSFFIILLILGVYTCFAQRNYATNSVLATGNWYKITITKQGIYKIDVAFLNTLGINTNNLSSVSIRLFGNGGSMLAEDNAVPRIDDVYENAIDMYDGGDGIFNGNDYFLFYAEGPDKWLKDSLNKSFSHQKNLYADSAYYFINIGGNGKRIKTSATSLTSTTTVNTYNERYFYENDKVNFLNSGKEWYGEEFSTVNGNTLTRNFPVDFSGFVINNPIQLNTSLASRSIGGNSNFLININSQFLQNINIASVSGYFLDAYAVQSNQSATYIPNQSSLNISINYNQTVAGAQGWLNWFEVLGRKNLSMNNANQLFFRDWNSVAASSVPQFVISGTNNTTIVWNISNALEPVRMNTSFNTNQTTFINTAESLKEYVCFNNANFLIPVAIGKINNQNLHNSTVADYLIITPPDFETEAQKLAAFHTQQYGYKVTVALTNQIYNEFSSGIKDPTAIRDFIKMYYDKAGTDSTKKPKYVLLLGAASYDYKNRLAYNTNYVPAYESANALDPLSTYVSDDFFGLINDSDNINTATTSSTNNILNVGIGRLPARNKTEAAIMVQKIVNYHINNYLGNWKNECIFVADDKDNNIHLHDAELNSSDAALSYPNFNITKLYLDAFPLVSGSGGARYPSVNSAIVSKISNGIFLFNYNGHGGYRQLADEAVLGADETKQFHNSTKLPLFITATCDFAPYDDPSKNSLGGSLLYNDSTGAIALMTTTRPVFANSNAIMNDNYIKTAFTANANGNYLTLGDAVKQAKNYTYQTSTDVLNNRKFTLLGDPAMKLAFPKYKIRLDSINNHFVLGNDTLKALDKYTLVGSVTDILGNILNNFNGTVYPTLFDKPQIVSTLGNDPASPVTTFSQQTNIIYKGKATVTNGKFNFSFVVPKDINYNVGNGKLSLYADNGNTDAAGVSTNFKIGNTSSEIVTDNVGPDIKIYLNDYNFKDEGLTNETPLLLVKLADSSGINTTGLGIGHDITAVIDGDERNLIVLNNYYEAALNNYQQGTVTYQLPIFTEGIHSIKIKAWDVVNNSNEATIHFKVSKQEKLVIKNLYNYPNPFTNKTTFSFEHNQPGSDLSVQLNIYNFNGALVQSFSKQINNSGDRSIDFVWDGTTTGGRKALQGNYIYRIIVQTKNQTATLTQQLYLH